MSVPGKGSTFTLYLPQTFAPQKVVRKPSIERTTPNLTSEPALAAPAAAASREGEVPLDDLAPEMSQLINEVGDDRNSIQPDDAVMLIVENDLGFAKVLLESARRKGFKGLVTSLGAAALTMSREYHPSAMTLDIHLPDIQGWRVLERLKNDVNTRHIPVWAVTTEEMCEPRSEWVPWITSANRSKQSNVWKD